MPGKLSTYSAASPRQVSRRLFLKTSATMLAAGSVISLTRAGPAAAQAKDSKENAQYQDTPKGGQQCGGCAFFATGENICSRVEGDISPNGWCKYFAAKAA